MNPPTIIPTMRYHDAPAAIKWLCRVLDFQEKVIYPTADGKIANAQLTFGNGMIMLNSKQNNAFDQLVDTPTALNNINTMTPYLIVEDVDAHYQKAKKEGAEIVMDIKTQPHGRGYTCRDPEGYLWNFGDYNPWK